MEAASQAHLKGQLVMDPVQERGPSPALSFKTSWKCSLLFFNVKSF